MIDLPNSAITFLSFITLVRFFTCLLRSLTLKLQSGPFWWDSCSLSFTLVFPSNGDSDHVLISVLTFLLVLLSNSFLIALVIFDHISDCLFGDAFNMGASATNFVADFRLELTYISFNESVIGSSIPVFIHLILLLLLSIETKAGSKAKFEIVSNNWKKVCKSAKWIFVKKNWVYHLQKLEFIKFWWIANRVPNKQIWCTCLVQCPLCVAFYIS